MSEKAKQIQIVMNTIGVMEIPPTWENVNRLTGIYQLLRQLRDELDEKPAEETDGEVEDDG